MEININGALLNLNVFEANQAQRLVESYKYVAEEAEKAPAHGHHAAGVCRAAAGGGALGRALRAEPVCRGQAGSRPCGGREGAVCADRPILAG